MSGHNNRGKDWGGPRRPAYSRIGVPGERVQPLIEWLIQRYGLRGTARVLGMWVGYVWKLRTCQHATVTQRNARRIAEVVLAHRRQGLRSIWDVEPRAAVAEERRNDDREREHKRAERERRRESA